MRSHNVSQLFAYVKSNTGISFFIYCLLFYFYTLFLFITAKKKMSTHRGKARCVCVWRVLLRANQTLSLNVIFEPNIEGLLK
jgi:hypothetical protein